MRRTVWYVFVASGILMLAAAAAGAQDSSATRSHPQVCLGFAFGGFVPKLDWAKAGHAPIRPGSEERTADGRGWASDQALPNDSSLYLFPAWWPVGIWVQLSARPAADDTVSGEATALVARGDIVPPVAKVKAWRVPCDRAAVSSPPRQAGDSAAQRARRRP